MFTFDVCYSLDTKTVFCFSSIKFSFFLTSQRVTKELLPPWKKHVPNLSIDSLIKSSSKHSPNCWIHPFLNRPNHTAGSNCWWNVFVGKLSFVDTSSLCSHVEQHKINTQFPLHCPPAKHSIATKLLSINVISKYTCFASVHTSTGFILNKYQNRSQSHTHIHTRAPKIFC